MRLTAGKQSQLLVNPDQEKQLLPYPFYNYCLRHRQNIKTAKFFFLKREKIRVDILKLEEKELRKIRGNKISMIFQEPMTSLNPVKTCGKQVIEAIRIHQNISEKEARRKNN